MLLLLEDNLFPYLLMEDFRMLHVVTTGAYYPPVVTTWKILTTGASQLTAGSLCSATVVKISTKVENEYSDVQISKHPKGWA